MQLDETGTSRDRKAPYVTYAAFKQFVDRYQRVNRPAKVDVGLLKMFNIAPSNEWALISALKFMDLIDASGVPTSRFSLIQAGAEGLKEIVEAAYGDLFAHGYDLEKDDFDAIRRYFGTTYSVSQSDRAAKFFIKFAQDAGIAVGQQMVSSSRKPDQNRPAKKQSEPRKRAKGEQVSQAPMAAHQTENLLQAKSKLLEKFPTFDSSWQPEAITAVVQSFERLLTRLDETGSSQDRTESEEEDEES